MIIFLVFLFIFFPFLVFAQSIVINEIAWMGTPVAGIEQNQWWRYEWLELYNAGDIVGMLDGWTVELSREKIDFKISLSGTIFAHDYFLIGASDRIPNVDLNYKNLGGKFNNSGQRVILKNSLGEVVDEVDATSGRSGSEEPSGSQSWPAGENDSKRTMERTEKECLHCEALSEVEGAKQWQTSAQPGGTPRAQNSQDPPNFMKLSLAGKKKDLPRPSFPRNPSSANAALLLIAFPGSLLAGVLTLAARRFLLQRFGLAQRLRGANSSGVLEG